MPPPSCPLRLLCLTSSPASAWAQVSYLLRRRLSSFFWSLNSNDGQTGGLLKNWGEPDPKKAALLLALPTSSVLRLLPAASLPGALAPRAAGGDGSACAQPYKDCSRSHCCLQARSSGA